MAQIWDLMNIYTLIKQTQKYKSFVLLRMLKYNDIKLFKFFSSHPIFTFQFFLKKKFMKKVFFFKLGKKYNFFFPLVRFWILNEIHFNNLFLNRLLMPINKSILIFFGEFCLYALVIYQFHI